MAGYGARRPLIIGLTGSIGMGKSTVAAMFLKHRVPVFDADLEVRKLQGPGGAALAAIEACFPGVTGPEGLNRQALGAQVFGKPEKLRELEQIMHPIVARVREDFLCRHRFRRAVVLDVPLLLEGASHAMCDLVCVVSAPFAVQRARVTRRPGMSEERFLNVLAHQMPDAEKRKRADLVIETGRGRRVTRAAVAGLVAMLVENRGRLCMPPALRRLRLQRRA